MNKAEAMQLIFTDDLKLRDKWHLSRVYLNADNSIISHTQMVQRI